MFARQGQGYDDGFGSTPAAGVTIVECECVIAFRSYFGGSVRTDFMQLQNFVMFNWSIYIFFEVNLLLIGLCIS